MSADDGLLYEVHWYSQVTGARGNGKPMPYGAAAATRDHANKEFPDLKHWLVPAPNPLPPTPDRA